MLRFWRSLCAHLIPAHLPEGANPSLADVIFLEEDAAISVHRTRLCAPGAERNARTASTIDRRGGARIEARHTALVGAQGGRRRAIAVGNAGLVRRDADQVAAQARQAVAR